VDPLEFRLVGAGTSVSVTFANNGFDGIGRVGDTITRATGTWTGFATGSLVKVTGSSEAANNTTIASAYYTVKSVSPDGKTLILSSIDVLTTSAIDTTTKAPIAETVTIERGSSPLVTEIVIDQRDDLDVFGTGVLNVDAGGNVLIGSENDLKLDYVKAGGDARLKTATTIENDSTVAGRANVKSGDLILEAANGTIGTPAAPVRTDLQGTHTLTARAFGNVYLDEIAGTMYLETIFSKTATVRLTADASIVDALNTDFTKIKAQRIELEAGIGGVAGSIGEGGAPPD